jgi:hypothetical protein
LAKWVVDESGTTWQPNFCAMSPVGKKAKPIFFWVKAKGAESGDAAAEWPDAGAAAAAGSTPDQRDNDEVSNDSVIELDDATTDDDDDATDAEGGHDSPAPGQKRATEEAQGGGEVCCFALPCSVLMSA